jgi:sugar-specific transcriptional regulator TrmB
MDSLKKAIKLLARSILPRSIRRLIYRRLANRYIAKLHVALDSSRKTILIVNHFFDQDVHALTRANKNYNLVVIDAPRLFRGAKLFFSEAVQGLMAPYNKTDSRCLGEYRRECELILENLVRRFDPALIVTPSDVFYWIRELIAVARDRGIATVVIDKEGTISPYDFDAESRRIKNVAPFMSEHIFVWSDRQREFWGKVGVDGAKITVIGQPRSDLLHHERRSDLDEYFRHWQRLVTFLSYMDNAYIPVKLIQDEQLVWSEMRDQSHDEIHRLACQHTNFNFIIKTHPQQPDLNDLRQKYERENLMVIGGSSVAYELLQRSELIIAFQTTAVIEAMLLNKRVIYTYWDPLIPRLEKDLLPFQEAPGIVVVRSLNVFRETCDRFFAGDNSPFEFTASEVQARAEFVDRYFYKPDGRVCDRFFEAVGRYVK